MSRVQVVEYAGLSIVIKRKAVKHFTLRISHTKAKVELSAPLSASAVQIEQVLVRKEHWLRQQGVLLNNAPIRAAKHLTHAQLLGEEYDVSYDLHLKSPFIVDRRRIVLNVDPNRCVDLQCKALHVLYRQTLLQCVPALMSQAVALVGLKPPQWRLRQMHTRWGSCNIGEQRIWLSTYLASKSPELISYVIIHELVHLYERYHNDRFYSYMQQFCPNYKQLDKELNNLY